MAKKEFIYRGKTLEELKAMSVKEFASLMTARKRRTLLREQPEAHQIFMRKIEARNTVKTHCRDVVIVPQMAGKTVKVHNGKEFVPVMIEPDMIGHTLGEFAPTRKRVMHHAPGIGATRSSASLSVK